MEKAQTVIYVTNNIGSVGAGAVVKGVEIGQLTAAGGAPGVIAVERRIPRVPAPRRPQESLLLGRDAALQPAVERVRQGGKFYFHGAYGVGKTSLSSELFNRVVAAGEPGDGYLWGSLAGMGVEDALEWIAGALQESTVSEIANPQAKINALRQAISLRRQLLIGLDDVRDGAVAQAVIEAAGDCPLILNGPRNLDLGGRAISQELEPLSLADARSLFESEAYSPGAAPGGDEPAQIERIVERCGRLPLAVRLTARQRRMGVSPARLLDMLEYSPEAVFSTEEALLAYLRNLQQELRDLPAAAGLLARLAAFPAHHAPVEALQSGVPKRAYYTAESFLVERSIVDRLEGDRLQLHGFLALWFQSAEPQACETERAFVEGWLAGFARRKAEAQDYTALEVEQANLLGLLERFEADGRRDALVGLLRSLFDYLRVRGMWAMNIQALEAALQDPAALGDERLAGWSYLQRGYMHTLRGERQAAERDLGEADDIFAHAGDLVQRGETWYRQAALTQMSGDLNAAVAQLEQALAWMGESAALRARAGAHERLAILYATQGKLQDAEAHFQKAVALGEPEVQAAAYIKLGSLRREAGDPAGAQAYFAQALPLIESLGHNLQRALLHQEMGTLALQSGQREQAQAHYDRADALYTQLNYPAGLAYAQHLLGNLAFTGGDYEAARRRYNAALEINLAQGLEANAAYNRFMLGVVAHRSGQAQEALSLYTAALEAARSMDDVGLQASSLYQLGDLRWQTGELEDARTLVGEARRMAEEIDDRQTQAAALALLGRIQAADGRPDEARRSLAQAYTIFAAYNPGDAQKVARLLEALSPEAEAPLAPIDLDRLEGGGHILQGNIDVLGSHTRLFDEADERQPGAAQSSPAPSLVPEQAARPAGAPGGDPWDASAGIDRIQEGGVFRDFDAAEPAEDE